MITIIMWFAALLCTDPTHFIEDHGDCPLEHVNSLAGPGGETGSGPRPPITPPPPPPGNGG